MLHTPDQSLQDYELRPFGDSAVLVCMGADIDRATNERVRRVLRTLTAQPFVGFVECVPGYATVAVFYDPLQLNYPEACAVLAARLPAWDAATEDNPRTIDIPVCYGGEFGPDLEFVAKTHGLTPQEVIAIHSGAEYAVYLIGFAPGFPYLGGLPEQIATARRETPRTKIPRGSVGIGGTQTGIYPIETPGGWQLIGRTPWALFCPEQNPPSRLRAGDLVRFRSITADMFASFREASP